MRGTIWIVVVVFVVAAIGFGGAASLTHDDASEIRPITNESHTLDAQDASTLDAADEWDEMYHNETVRDANGTELERGTDYSIDYETGELLAENASYDGADVTVDYWYDWTDATSDGTGQVLNAVLGPLVGLLAIVAAIGALANWMGMM